MQKFLSGLAIIIGSFLFSILQSAAANQFYEQVVGDAYRFDSKDLLYREIHCEAKDTLSREVYYQQVDGTLIAHKTLDYRSGHTTPSFIQQDIRTTEKVQVSFDQTELVMSVTDSRNEERENIYPISDMGNKAIVIDAGFDELVRQNWHQLVAGQTKEFEFPLASRASLISLQIKSSNCGYKSDSDQCFTLEPSNWFFRMLASPVELGYDSQLIRLTRYRGLSNLNDENGNGLVVDIRYRYTSVPGRTCSIERLLLSNNKKISQ
jgi:hypothetical protein